MCQKKNWFYYLNIAFALIGLLYSFVCGFPFLTKGRSYPYFYKGAFALGILGLWIAIWLLAQLSARFRFGQKLSVEKRWIRYAEVLFVALVLGFAVIIRIFAIQQIPIEPDLDYKIYYEIAELLEEGSIQRNGGSYSDYIALFPYVMGYSYILKTAFKIFGVHVIVGQYLNIFFAVATVYFIYKLARKAGGRIAGIIALLLSAFWPSQILHTVVLSPEHVFSFFACLSTWIFISLILDYNGETEHAVRAIVQHVILGVLLAFTVAIHPRGLILLAAIIIMTVCKRMKMPSLPKNDIPLAIRGLEWGWFRCIMILLPYLLMTFMIRSNIELTVDRNIATLRSTAGYHLLAGFHIDEKGAWNEADELFLYSAFEESGSASKAHRLCRDQAIKRVKDNPARIQNLLAEKYELFWEDDNNAVATTSLFLQRQGQLTQARNYFLISLQGVNQMLYLMILFFSMISLIYLWRIKADVAFFFTLPYSFTAIVYLFMESRSQYKYWMLQILMILAGMAVQFIFADIRDKKVVVEAEQEEVIEKESEKESIISEKKREEAEMTQLRVKALENVFDMQKALESGHIIMTVSEAYKAERTEKKDTEKKVAEKKDNLQKTES